MIDFYITMLLSAIVITTIWQPSAPRLLASLYFALEITIHDIFFSDLYGLAYYASAALSSLLVIILTMGINPTPRTVVALQRICMASIIANAVGYILWYKYFDPTYYDLSFVLIYGWAFFTLIKKDPDDERGFGTNQWRSCFRFDLNSVYRRLSKNEGEI